MSSERSSEKLNVFLIEDNPDDEIIFTELLQSALGKAYELRTAESIKDACTILNEYTPDIILSDLSLPDSTGFETLEHVQDKANSAPVILLTGLSDDTLAKEMVSRGAQDYLVKGEFNSRQLEKAIDYAIERKKAYDLTIKNINKFRVIFMMSSDILIVINSNGFVIEEINPAAEKKLKYTSDEIKGQSLSRLIIKKHYSYFKKSISTGLNVFRKETLIHCSNGSVFPGDVAGSPILNQDGTVGSWVLSIRDITLQKKKEITLIAEKKEAENYSQKINYELEIAREIQQGLAPEKIEHFEGVAIASDLIQAKQVGGDYYDVIPLNDNEIALIIVDVTGHDIAAAFVVGMAKMSFETHIRKAASLTEVFESVNRDMIPVVKGRYLSAFIAVIDTCKKIVRYSKAGHYEQFLYAPSTGKIHELSTSGMLLGAFEDGCFEEQSVDLNIGDKLILFTDGICENTNTQDEQYGLDRFRNCIMKAGRHSADELNKSILNDYTAFCGGMEAFDDLCLLIAEFTDTKMAAQIAPILKPEQITIPPVLIDSESASALVTGKLLSKLDMFGFNDALIRHYREFFRRLFSDYLVFTPGNERQLRVLGKIEENALLVIFVNQKQNDNDKVYFRGRTFHTVLLGFNQRYGRVSLNEEGDRLTITYRKSDEKEETKKDVLLEERVDGIYLTISATPALKTAPEKFIDQLLNKKIVNVPYELIYTLFKEKTGVANRIADGFKYYNSTNDENFKLEHDSQKAVLEITAASLEPGWISEEELHYILRKEGIVYGIDKRVFDEIVNKPGNGERYTIAEGIPAINETPETIVECIPIIPTKKPIEKDDGSIDFKVIDLLKTVKTGTVIMRKNTSRPSQTGRSIYGHLIDPVRVEPVVFPVGENTAVNEDGTELVALVDGFIVKDEKGVHVKQLYYVNGNVDYSTGSIDYGGDLYVTGNVQTGFNLNIGGSITIEGEIEPAAITTERGNLLCKNGIFGRSDVLLNVGKDLFADFIQDAIVDVKGEMHLQKYLLNTKAFISGNVFVGEREDGRIIGGEITCYGSIVASELGNREQTETVIVFPEKRNDDLKQRITRAVRKKKEIETEYRNLENQLKNKSHIFRIKTQKTTDDKKLIEGLLGQFFEMKQKLARAATVVEMLSEKEAKTTRYGNITVKKCIYPNVVLRFGTLERKMTTKTGPSRVSVKDNKIVMMPLDE